MRIESTARLLLYFLLCSFGLIAPLGAQERISPDAFLDAANGKTLTFTDLRSGVRVGIEEYLSRDLSVWKDLSLIHI